VLQGLDSPGLQKSSQAGCHGPLNRQKSKRRKEKQPGDESFEDLDCGGVNRSASAKRKDSGAAGILLQIRASGGPVQLPTLDRARSRSAEGQFAYRRLLSATPLRATHVYHRERGTGALCTAMPTADLLARDLTGDTISPRGLRASAGPGIGSARIRHRTCA
jgi:hypothetical protein